MSGPQSISAIPDCHPGIPGANQAARWLNRKRRAVSPDCMCPVFFLLIRYWHDRYPGDDRTSQLLPLTFQMICTAGNAALRRRRKELIYNWLIREMTPNYLLLVPGCERLALALQGLPELKSKPVFRKAMQLVRHASEITARSTLPQFAPDDARQAVVITLKQMLFGDLDLNPFLDCLLMIRGNNRGVIEMLLKRSRESLTLLLTQLCRLDIEDLDQSSDSAPVIITAACAPGQTPLTVTAIPEQAVTIRLPSPEKPSARLECGIRIAANSREGLLRQLKVVEVEAKQGNTRFSMSSGGEGIKFCVGDAAEPSDNSSNYFRQLDQWIDDRQSAEETNSLANNRLPLERGSKLTLAQWCELAEKMRAAQQLIDDCQKTIQATTGVSSSEAFVRVLRGMTKSRLQISTLMTLQHGRKAAEQLFFGPQWAAWH